MQIKQKTSNQRVLRRFAFLPIRIGTVVVWLETYYIVQRREDRYGGWITLFYCIKDTVNDDCWGRFGKEIRYD